jgi:hypothetical protein
MRKHHFITSLVIFVAGFVLSAIVDGRHLASLAQGTLSDPAAPKVAAQITQLPSTSQKWEYRVVTRYISVFHYFRGETGGLSSELNQLGEQGYEVCGVAQGVFQGQSLTGTDQGATLLTITLRRPK